MHLVLDHGAVLVGAVVVAGDGAGADVDVASHRGIADVGEVVGLGAGADVGLLHLDEVADVDFLLEARARAQPRVGADAAILADAGRVDVAERLDARAGADLGVADHAVGADLGAVGELDLALEHAVDIDAHVRPAGQAPAHVDTQGIGERDTGVHQPPRVAALVNALELSELLLAVHAQDLPAVGGLDARQRDLVLERERHYAGQVVLALGVVIVEPGDPVLQARRGQRHDAGVDLADLALRGARVLLLDDRSDGAAPIAHDAAVT